MAEAPGDTRGPARPTHGSHASFVRPWLARHDNAPSASAQRALARPLCQLANAQIPCRTGLPFPASTRATPGSSQSRTPAHATPRVYEGTGSRPVPNRNALRAFVGLRRPPGWRPGRRGEPWLRPACLKAAGAMDGPAAVYQGITTSSEMMTGFPAVTPAGVGRATPAEGPGDPPGPIGTETPAGMPPSITAPCPSHELQPERGAADSQQAPCC